MSIFNSRPFGRRIAAVVMIAGMIVASVPIPGQSAVALAQSANDEAASQLHTQIYELVDTIHVLQDILTTQMAGEVLGASIGETYRFLLSKKADRSAAVPFDGATVSGSIYPFLEADANVGTVQFYLDDPQMTRPPLRTEIAPFDFGGGSRDGDAYPFSTTRLTNGRHVAGAKLIFKDGTMQSLQVNFFVANGVATPSPTPTPAPSMYNLLLSSAPNRSNPTPLAGKTVSGSIYVFVGPERNVNTVKFYLDDPQMTRPPLRTEIAPFDFGGGSRDGDAYPFSTTRLTNGPHTISAALQLAGGTLQKISATFAVNNATPTGTPPPAFALTVAKSGTGSGSIVSNPTGIDCGSTCTANYSIGSVVRLSATPQADSSFVGWTGPADCGDGSVTVSAAMTCTAVFNLKSSPTATTTLLAVAKTGTGTGRIVSEPAGIDCGGTCTARYATGTVVALTATPDEGSTFSGWVGDTDCADSSLTMSANRSCTATFVKTVVTPPPTSSPSSISLSVNEYSGVTRSGEVLSSGVPLPESLNLRDTSPLRVVNASGQAVPAQFRVIARWNGGRNDAAKPIKWVLVTFAGAVPARAIGTYRLLTNGAGANPAPTASLSVSQSGNVVTVNTGAATFVVGPNSLFNEVKTSTGAALVNGGAMSATFEGQSADAQATPRNVIIRSSGPLSAIIEVEGVYGLSFGGGPISFTRRYEFKAGSPTALIRHVVDWEGSFSGNSWWATGKTPTGYNILEGQKLRDTLNLAFTPTSVKAVGSYDSTVDAAYNGQEVALRTLLRNKGADGTGARWQPRRYQVTSGTTVLENGSKTGLADGKLADGGMIAIQGPGGTLALALDHMQDYEPQALRVLPGNKAAIDIADDKFRLAMFQGLFANMAVSALPAGASRTELNEKVWAPLNQPLRALPTAQWLNQTEAWDKIPAGSMSGTLAAYQTLMPAMLENTLSKADHEGLAGLMTHGLWPRYWAEYPSTPSRPTGEIGNGDWDAVFRDTTWTDYYSTTAAAAMWSITSGDPKYINELTEPAALRTLHTQIFQGGPSSNLSAYFGQAPGGYGGYRADFNSKHQYWDNLFLYYYLTGDEIVPETIQRGGLTQLDRFYQGSAGEVGAVPGLWMAAWRFLGGTVSDSSLASRFMNGFRDATAKIITDHYNELTYQGDTYGFVSDERLSGLTFNMTSAWTLGGYDMENMYWFMRMTNDAPVGPAGVTPSRVIKNLAKTFVKILPSPTLRFATGELVGGDGTIAGKWAREIQVTRAGNQVGGAIASIAAVDKQGELLLFPGDKPYFAAFLSQAADLGADPSVRTMARSLIDFALPRMRNMVLGKLGGLGVNRLITAVAEEAGF